MKNDNINNDNINTVAALATLVTLPALTPSQSALLVLFALLLGKRGGGRKD